MSVVLCEQGRRFYHMERRAHHFRWGPGWGLTSPRRDGFDQYSHNVNWRSGQYAYTTHWYAVFEAFRWKERRAARSYHFSK